MAIKRKKYASDGIIRVLYVNLEGSIAGAEQSLLLLIRNVPKTVQISAACPSGLFIKKLTTFDIRAYRISSPPHKFNTFVVLFFYMAIVNLQLILIVLRARPQIIHGNSAKAVLAGALARILTGSKLIWHMRDMKCSRMQAKICGCLSSRVIAVSKAVKNRLIELGVKPELIEVIYNGIAAEDIEVRKKDQNRPVIFANIGQFVPWKKQFLFIEAAERFLNEGFNAHFLLIGDDIFGRDHRYKNQIIDRIRNGRFAVNIKFIGWQNDIESFWPQIDCLVHTADAEPFGRVIIEAMAYGIPVIATAGGGPAEIIDSGRTGLLFTPDDLEGLLCAMKIIYHDKELAHNLAVNGREHVLSNFKAGKTSEKIAKLYEELMAA